VATNQIVGQVPVGGSPHHPAFSGDGAQAMVVSQDPNTLDVFDVGSRTPLGSISVGSMPHWIALNAGQAWVTNEGSGDVSIVDLASGSVVGTVIVGNAPRKIAIAGGTP
jgi:YVTN family beta-propeller protein